MRRWFGVLMLAGCAEAPPAHLRLDVDTVLVDAAERELSIADEAPRSVACALDGAWEPTLRLTASDGFGSAAELRVDDYRGPGDYAAGVQVEVAWDGGDVVADGGLLARCTATIEDGSAAGVVRCDAVTVQASDGRTEDGGLFAAFWCPTVDRGVRGVR